MRIGEFCKKLNISPTTVRFYINSGLLATNKKNSQYHFTDIDIQEMQIILKLKELSFSIEETLKYLQIIRFYDIRDENTRNQLIPILESKKSTLLNDVSRLNNIIANLESEITCINNDKSSKDFVSGVPLSFSTYLSCPKCGGLFYLKNMEVFNNNIYSAVLDCKCGYHAKIEEGILLVHSDSNYYISDEFTVLHYGEKPPKDQDFVFFQYMQKISSEATALIYKSYRWIDDKIREKQLSGKVIFVPDLASHFLYKNINSPYFKDAFIIVSGFSKKTINSIKSHIDLLNPGLNIIYIANTIYELPIRKGLIDLWIDAISSYNFSFFHNYTLQEKIEPYMSDYATIVGYTKYYDCKSKSLDHIKRIFPCAVPNYSMLSTFIKTLKACDYDIVCEDELGSLINPGKYYEYHHKGDYHKYHGFFARKKID